MTREMYDYIFNLRASGFMHHTQEDLQRILQGMERGEASVSPALLNNLPLGVGDGERGSLSKNQCRDMHNFLVGCCFFASSQLVEAGKDAEYAYGISDYYMNKLDSCYSLGDYQRFFEEMTADFQKLAEEETASPGQAVTNIHVIRGIHYIQQHLYSDLSASDVAAAIHKDASYLSTLFKKETGLTLQRYILQEKITEAQKMLRNTDHMVREIAEALGFCSAPHFNKVFAQFTGMTPGEYRS